MIIVIINSSNEMEVNMSQVAYRAVNKGSSPATGGTPATPTTSPSVRQRRRRQPRVQCWAHSRGGFTPRRGIHWNKRPAVFFQSSYPPAPEDSTETHSPRQKRTSQDSGPHTQLHAWKPSRQADTGQLPVADVTAALTAALPLTTWHCFHHKDLKQGHRL